jgi:hypothetical protein
VNLNVTTERILQVCRENKQQGLGGKSIVRKSLHFGWQLLASFAFFAGAGSIAVAQDLGDAHYPGKDREYYVGNAKSFYPQFIGEDTASPEVTTAIEGLVHEFASRWTAKTWPSVIELWDRDEPAPYILLAHQPDWLVGWNELDGYFSIDQKVPVKEIPPEASKGIQQIESRHYEYRAEKDLQAMLYTADRITVREIDDDLAVAIWYVDFQYKPLFTPPKAEHFKANAMFRNTKDGWRFIHYGEAPMSAIMYMERLYRSQVSQEFLDQLKKPKRREQGAQHAN